MRGGLEHWNRGAVGAITIRLMIATAGGSGCPGGPFPGPARGPRGGRSGEVPGGVLGCLERCFCVLLGCAGGALSVFKSSVRQRNSAERGSATCTTQGLSLSLSTSRSLTAALSLLLRSRACWRFFLGRRLGGVNRAVLKSRSSGQAERERAPCLSFEFKLSSGRERDASGRYPKSRIAPRGFGFKTAGASVACSSGIYITGARTWSLSPAS